MSRESTVGRRWGAARRLPAVTLTLAVAVVAGAACSPNADTTAAGRSGDKPAPASAARPTGPAAKLQQLTGGKGVSLASATQTDLSKVDYVEHEYTASGTATSYQATGKLGADGHWAVKPDGTAPYSTRIVVRRPAATDKASGTVVVEWLNVSSGSDASSVWSSTQEEIIRRGDIWVGVSAQRIGVMGGTARISTGTGTTQTTGLRGADPDRYRSLNHPGDGFAFDMYTQVARALRTGGDATGGVQPKRILAAGQSQSAYGLVTYLNAVRPLSKEYDGFLLQSRGRGGMPLAAPGEAANLDDPLATTPAIIRTDIAVPVLDVQAEGDLSYIHFSVGSRQDDSDHFRLWEVAGTSHADAHTFGSFASAINCGVAVNNAPMHIVVKAALHALDTWVTTGTAPATAPRIDTTDAKPPVVVRDGDGIAKGGVRTPPVDVPVDVLSGTPGPVQSDLCGRAGSTAPLPADRLAALYPSRDDYQKRYTAAVDATIKAGFALRDDRDALLGYAQPGRLA